MRLAWVVIALCASPLAAQPVRVTPSATATTRTARHMESLRGDPVRLRAFLRALPKGGDLHSHLSGAVYAESLLRWAAEDGLCVDTVTTSIVKDMAPCDAGRSLRAAADAHTDPAFHAALVDALSVRNHQLARNSGHDQFFGTFRRFGPVSATRRGDMLAEVARRAAAQEILYLELTGAWDVQVPRDAAARVEWTDDLEALRQRLLDAGLRAAPRTAQLDEAEQRLRDVLRCGTAAAEPACAVTVRYHAEGRRAATPVDVFAQLVWAFEQNAADPRFVGVNFVQPEDWHVPVRDYALHMRMFGFLHSVYPKVHITLHAGELTLGRVPPEVLGTHIGDAIRVGQAERIGHGTDLAYVRDQSALLAEMKAKRVAVEISPSSSDIILGVRGAAHPLRTYLRAGVPVVIATDDEGVSRSDLTHEYQRAVVEMGLRYLDLKQVSRDSLRHSFLPDGEKAALLKRLDAAFARFEQAHGR